MKVTKVLGAFPHGREPHFLVGNEILVGNERRKRETSYHAMSARVYVSLGSNVGDREAQLRDAQTWLGVAGRIVKVSSFYETEPMDFTDQPWFLNCAVEFESTETPQQLMATILRIEQEMGRRRVQNKGPRAIDIDILLFGD